MLQAKGWRTTHYGEVEESSPMKRGLKCCDRACLNPIARVEESSPMKRGLKYPLGVFLWFRIGQVEESSPMKRGLK